MIDEWGNEVPENYFENLKNWFKVNRQLFIIFSAGFLIVFIFIQIVFLIIPKKVPVSINLTNTPTAFQPSPHVKRVFSAVATSSAFLEIVNNQASLSAQIENIDLYESSLVFPPVDTKVQFTDK